MDGELQSFLSDWLKEEKARIMPDIKIKESYLKIDGERIDEAMSMSIIAEWLREKRERRMSGQ